MVFYIMFSNTKFTQNLKQHGDMFIQKCNKLAVKISSHKEKQN